ncbi:MAG: DUF4202 domain-containing protein [Alphaproteobacteria bacterium]|nr:DUF4202 domain-containing protein [Alphaproteobacteria bacterium]
MPALDATIAAIDAANADDPRQIEGRAFELVYAERMSARLASLYPDASDLLKIATRAQHLRRWEIERSKYEEGRRGYNDWRRACRIHHANLVADIMRANGYDDPAIAHVGALIRKEQLKKDPESQALENLAAIVFLEHYFDDFLEKHRDYEDDKLVDILGKTLCKMSPRGHAAALALPFAPRARGLVEAALAREADALARLAAVAVD